MTTQLLHVGTGSDTDTERKPIKLPLLKLRHQLGWSLLPKMQKRTSSGRTGEQEEQRLNTLTHSLSVCVCVRERTAECLPVYMCVLTEQTRANYCERLLWEFCVEQKTLIAVIAVIKDLSDTPQSAAATQTR